MSEALQQLIQQAEEQKLEIEMQLRFAKNMNLFKQRFPAIHKTFENHKPKNVVLKLDPNRQLNLVDVEKRLWFYNDIPTNICKQQVDVFAKDAKVRKFHVVKSKEQNKRHFHIQGLNQLLDDYEQNTVKRILHTPHLITNLIVSGVGLGYHLLELVARLNIKNILIYENCKDTFFASLFAIDWEPILNYFADSERSIIFCLGVSPQRALEQVESAIHNVGLHSQIFTFVLKHTSRPCETDFLDLYVNEIRAFIGGLGYFDDERIGLAHAHHNIHSRNSVFINNKRQHRKTRLLIVGNGPSLDMHVEYLQQNKDKAVIFSCGTALSSLLRLGIKPDFHIEMERPTYIEDVINAGTTQEQRKGITLLCLHTVSPRTLACFEDACYAIKPNDAGGILVHDYFKPAKLPEMAFSNPTVTNCALAFAISMGFMDVHLIGVDLGVKEEGKHHSASSMYYEYDKLAKEKYPGYQPKYINTKETREGNFGGQVKTPPVLNMARASMERLLEMIVKTFPEFRCVNSNDGVKIAYTETRHLEELEPCPDHGKSKEIKHLRDTHFLHIENSSAKSSADHLAHFLTLKDELKLKTDINSEEALFNDANRILRQIKISKDPLTHFLMRGTANCYLGAIIENCLYCASQTDFQARAERGINAWNQIIDNIYKVMESDPFEIDDTVVPGIRNLRDQFEQKQSQSSEQASSQEAKSGA